MASGSSRSRRPRVTNSDALEAILGRLNAIESRMVPSQTTTSMFQPTTPLLNALPLQVQVQTTTDGDASVASIDGESMDRTRACASRGESNTDDVANRIVGALSSLVQVRSNHYYVSNFDPSVHDFDAWCAEVDRAREANHWNDNECLSRIGGCLRGEARSWLSDWVSADRTWTNFKVEFRSLCPRSIDVAGILFEVMSTDSRSYATYAEYARHSLLRLNIVKGLSDELKTAIVIRGIVDPQVKAASTNAKLQSKEVVEFLSHYTQPNHESRSTHNPGRSSVGGNAQNRKREAGRSEVRCFSCGKLGHRRANCFKKPRTEATVNSNFTNRDKPSKYCTFCKKPGHTSETCFVKQRTETDPKYSSSKVNLCREIKTSEMSVMSAVVQNTPVDVLIDTGAHVSLITKSALKHFSHKPIPTYHPLLGIGKQLIESTAYVTLIVEFPEISLEVDFYVVPDSCIDTTLLVGTDVLNREGVTFVRTSETQRLFRINQPTKVLNLQAIELSNLNTSLLGEEKEKLLSVVSEFSESFITGTATSTVNTGSMQIRLNNEDPVHYRPYKLSFDEKQRVRAIIKDLLEKNIIRESESEYASPIILVKKKDGSDRMCVDYRALNAKTVKDRFPLPLIDDHIDRLGSSKFFTSLDMATGFHQIKMDPASINKTAFVTPEGHYEYVKMPYGLTNAPVVYQRIISKTLKSFIDSGKVLVFIDDVLIMANEVTEGLETLREVLRTLTLAGFSINLKKCSFLTTEVEYLGRLISHGQVRPNPKKVEVLINAPRPTNVKQVRQFLGLAGYFRRYIPNYASKTACIANLTRKEVPFLWSKEQDVARDFIISCLTSEPVLAIFDPSLPTELHTDASAIGYGAVLLQEHEDKKKRVVGYFSRSTQGAESRYHSYELETLAIVKALQHFRQYLLGINFKIVTDCNSLKLTEKKKDLVPRVARWWVYMQDFQFTIQYRKGVFMSHVDYLSRNPVNINLIRRPNSWAQIAQSADTETYNLIEKLRQGELDSSRYVIKKDLLYYKYTPVGQEGRLLCYVPKGHRLSLLRIFHDEHSHIGSDKTIDLILRHFWFPGLRQFVTKYVSHCLVCLTHKRVPRAPHQPIESWSKPDIPFSTIHMDVLGPLPESKGNKYILVMVDAFSKYCLLYSLQKQDSDELKSAFNNLISLFGTPMLIINDRGRMFESSSFQDWVTSLGCKTHFITPEMHHENGQAERYCRTVLNMLRIEVNNNKASWSDILWKIQLVLNITKHKTMQTSALQLLIGIEASTPAILSLMRDVAVENSSPNREALLAMKRQRSSELLVANQLRQDSRVNAGRSEPRSFELGDFAFVIKSSQTSGKLDSGMRGPYKVVKALPHHRYELELLSGSYGKRTQAASEYMTPWRGEWTPDTCAALFATNQQADDSDQATHENATGDHGPDQRSLLCVDHASLNEDEDVSPSGTAVLEDN